jgi:hypothetical protein
MHQIPAADIGEAALEFVGFSAASSMKSNPRLQLEFSASVAASDTSLDFHSTTFA